MQPTPKRRFRLGRVGAVLLVAMVFLGACMTAPPVPTGSSGSSGQALPSDRAETGRTPGPGDRPFTVAVRGTFDEPWAMAFLPDGRAVITERVGRMLLVDPATGGTTAVAGTPSVVRAGQGGLGDVALAPSFADDAAIYLSWVEAGAGDTSGAVVGRATLRLDEPPRLTGLTVLWRQDPKVSGSGHFAHRLAVSPDRRHLFVSSGERQKFDPAQQLTGNLGKILRLDLDGAAAVGNPFPTDAPGAGAVAAQVWSMGHRNPLGLAFDEQGNLWSSEMGPQGGDEVNLIVPGRNYGWPKVSNGSHYGGADIPDHAPEDGFEAPAVWWNPSISPGSLLVYTGAMFPEWRGDLFVGALSGQALIRVAVDGTTARKGDQWGMGARIREVEQGPDGALWLLEDGPGGRLLRLAR